jgi:hypothetical protein
MVVLASAVFLSGCMIPNVGPPMLRVENLSPQDLDVSPKTADELRPPVTVAAGDAMFFAPDAEGCESRPWVAVSESGSVVAEIPGACTGHIWTIRGAGDSTYE